MAVLVATSGPLQQDIQRIITVTAATVPVLPYFCETGKSSGGATAQWFLDNPLWDSQGCASGSTCCNRGGPWFTTTLSQEASADIEIRMCHTHVSGTEYIGLEQLEILIN